ncbi:MAG: Flp pilus assembly complex ATPase component TadA [Planctomycetes bacterium]|nr:Flp pilus assembly complex ATPase component TadA [Planctomycetota bacterium]
MPGPRKRLGEILKEWGKVTDKQLTDALGRQARSGRRLGEILMATGACTEEDISRALALQFDMEYIDLDVGSIKPEVLEMMPEAMMKEYQIIPLDYKDGKLKVAITDPLDLESVDAIRFRLNMDVDCVLAAREKVKEIITGYTEEAESETVDTMLQEFTSSDVDFVDRGDKGSALNAESAPIIRLVQLMITEAVRMRASDIHIEPLANRLRIRYRIDGVCVERDAPPKRLQGSITTRVKLMSGMQIEEKRIPQDGRIRMKLDGQDLDFRVSTLPGYHGESIVLRILRRESINIGLEGLGFLPDDFEVFQKMIERPNGICLVTGPTGSGKTTTLYAALNKLNTPDRKIITAEDPVEYHIAGINQCQVNETINLTFQRILRAMLRQAPNVILVGEIRDIETAEMAIQAALTGHLVFSTLHTNDAPSAITRLIDMGVKPFLVASSVQAVMAQRLVRILCPECKEKNDAVDLATMRAMGVTEEQLSQGTFFRPAGCPKCHNMGFRGRLGIFEIMLMNTELRELAFKHRPLSEIRQAARLLGMRSLLEDGLIKVMRGITTLEEVLGLAAKEGAVL